MIVGKTKMYGLLGWAGFLRFCSLAVDGRFELVHLSALMYLPVPFHVSAFALVDACECGGNGGLKLLSWRTCVLASWLYVYP